MVFSIITPLGIRIDLTEESFSELKAKHEEIESINSDDIELTLAEPDFISLDEIDSQVFLYNKLLTETPCGPKICVVVAKHLRERGFIITIYLTSKIKKGRIVWTRK